MGYPEIIVVEFEARDEVELVAFINYLLNFDWPERIRVKRVVPKAILEEEHDG
jgi:hypothetical protein